MSAKEGKKRYCICRSTIGEGFMVQCENCEDWFHGRCIGVTQKQMKDVPQYFCDECCRKDAALWLIMNPPKPEEPESKVDQVKVKQEPLEERKQEKKIVKKKQPSKPIPKVNFVEEKPAQIKHKPIQKAKHKLPKKGPPKGREQCANPSCTSEARNDSKYCTDECGYEFNKLRYEHHFLPKWQALEKNHSQARLKKMKDLDQLEKDKVNAEELIRSLKAEKIELDANIQIIKEEAARLYELKVKEGSKENEDSDSEADNEEGDILTGDQARSFCIICGAFTPTENIFKHWGSCHKKHEAIYAFTADALVNPTCPGDENPKLYCHKLVQEKTSKRFCMHLESACPQHSNWQCNQDEVCGCPVEVMQKLVPDGNYCLELKKNCSKHYHWEKFRLAQLNMLRVQAFARLDFINDRIRVATTNLNDTYGGVVGVMLHNTIDHRSESNSNENIEVVK